MIEIKNLTVKVKDTNKIILNNLNLKLEKGKVHLLVGKNGTGKSTLLNAIMGNPSFVSSGEILVDGENILSLSPDKIAKKGFFLSFQNPEEIEGVKLTDFLSFVNNKKYEEKDEKPSVFTFAREMQKEIKKLNITEDVSKRYLNVGFSGGEKKKNELLQMKILKPKYIMLDEIDSGLDIDAVKIVSKNIKEYMENDKEEKILLIVSHHFEMLKNIGVDKVHVLSKGKILKSGGIELLEKMKKEGFKAVEGAYEEN